MTTEELEAEIYNKLTLMKTRLAENPRILRLETSGNLESLNVEFGSSDGSYRNVFTYRLPAFGYDTVDGLKRGFEDFRRKALDV